MLWYAHNMPIGSLICPACEVPQAPKFFSTHTQRCVAWKLKGWDPLPTFKYDPWSKSELFVEGAKEGVDYLQCRVCAQHGLDFRFARLKQHVEVHGLTVEQYQAKYQAAVNLETTTAKRKATNLEVYGVESPVSAPEVAALMRAKCRAEHGVDHPSQIPDAVARRNQTNLDRYGVVNPFESAAFQDKAKAAMLTKYGVENAQQVPEIRARTEATTLERHGARSFLQTQEWLAEHSRRAREREADRRARLMQGPHEVCPHCDEVFKLITSTHKAICAGWPEAPNPEPCLCGHESASFTSMKRHRQVCVVWLERDVNEVAWMRRMATVRERYGVEHIAFSAEIQERMIRTCLAKIDLTFPEISVPAQTAEDLVERYGVTHPMQHEAYAQHHFTTYLDPLQVGPNKFERAVGALAPWLLYTGDFTFWRWLPALGRKKNPDFIVPGPDPEHPRRDVTKVVECNGNYFHSEKFTGKSLADHEAETIAAYAEIGLQALVIWEEELAAGQDEVRRKLAAFLR